MFAAAQTRRRQHPIVNELCLPHPTQLPDDARAGAWLRVRTTCTVILPRLKQATFARHAAIKSPSVLLAPGLSRATCRGSLRRFWGYCAPSVSRPKNWNRPDVPRAVRPAHPGAAVRLSGCLDVIEGATLGGPVVTRHLQASLGLTPLSGGAFFSGYVAHKGSHLKCLRRAPERVRTGIGGRRRHRHRRQRDVPDAGPLALPDTATRHPAR